MPGLARGPYLVITGLNGSYHRFRAIPTRAGRCSFFRVQNVFRQNAQFISFVRLRFLGSFLNVRHMLVSTETF